MTSDDLGDIRRQPVDSFTQQRFEEMKGRALSFVSEAARELYLSEVDVCLIVSSLDACALKVGQGSASRVVAIPRHRCCDLRDEEILFCIAWDAASLLLPAREADRQCRRWGFAVPRRCKRSRYWPCSVTINARSQEPSR